MCQVNNLLLALLLVAAVSPLLANPGIKTGTGSFTKVEIRSAIIQSLGEPDPEDKEIRFISRYADLNEDRQPELLVWAGCCGYGGTGGYPLLIFTCRNRTLKLLSMIDLVWTPLVIQKAKRHGWHDIVMQEGGGGQAFRYVVSHFTGKGYSDKLQAIRPERVKGKWLVGRRRVMTITGPLPLIK